MTESRRIFAWAGERRRRSPEPQFASPPVATRNGLAQPTRIGAPRVSEPPSAQTDRRSPPPDCVFLANEEPPEDPGRTHFKLGMLRGGGVLAPEPKGPESGGRAAAAGRAPRHQS